MDWDAWVMAPGLPPVELDFMTPNITVAQKLADEYIAMPEQGKSPNNSQDYKTWYSNLKVVFLERLISQSDKFDFNLLVRID